MVSLTNFHRDKIWHILQNESVISDEFTNTHVLPCFAVCVLEAKGIVFGQLRVPDVMEGFSLGHAVMWGFAVASGVLFLSAR